MTMQSFLVAVESTCRSPFLYSNLPSSLGLKTSFSMSEAAADIGAMIQQLPMSPCFHGRHRCVIIRQELEDSLHLLRSRTWAISSALAPFLKRRTFSPTKGPVPTILDAPLSPLQQLIYL
jgi:hypothetical protein